MQTRSSESLSPGAREDDPRDYWFDLGQAHTAAELCRAWLPILCSMLPQVRAGLLLLRDTDGSYVPVAVWPLDLEPSYLGDVAGEALGKRQGAVHRAVDGRVQFAYPLLAAEQTHGAVVLDLDSREDAILTQAMRLTHWGAGWLVDLFGRALLREQDLRLANAAFVLDLSLSALGEADFAKAALAVANRLAQRFACIQVLVGVEKGKAVRVAAVSHAAWFDERSTRVNLAALAMDEAFDQRTRVVWPEPPSGAVLITAAHRRYAEECGSRTLCSVPLEAGGRVVATWLLERDEAFTAEELDLLDTLALALGPVLGLKLGADEGLFAHARRSGRRLLQRCTDTSRPGLKLLALLLTLAVAILALYRTDYRVAAQAVVEGAVQRVVAAPFDSYIREASARAGDVVRRDQTLARLDDKDLELERVRWEAELEVALRREREAMAGADRVALRLAAAQAGQARAQLDLVLARLERVQIRAPFDGVVMRGDLSQELGAPVEQGKVLFEIAPLDAWRVILKADERDIASLREGQSGELILTSLTGKRFAFQVKRVTPVSIAEEGRNYFRVEADLRDNAPELRPGMEGVAKVYVGKASLLWIWTHRFTDWLHLAWWKWTP